MTKQTYFSALEAYMRGCHLPLAPAVGAIPVACRPIIREFQSPGGAPAGNEYYNHSTFCDLVITGLAGVRPQDGDMVIINPLIPDNTWDYFCLDNVAYHGRTLTVFYDRDGTRYGRGAGLQALVDGKVAAKADVLRKVTVDLSSGPNDCGITPSQPTRCR